MFFVISKFPDDNNEHDQLLFISVRFEREVR